ncbi:unnamed protein product, partial [Mesorhabditis spiculigera]
MKSEPTTSNIRCVVFRLTLTMWLAGVVASTTTNEHQSAPEEFPNTSKPGQNARRANLRYSEAGKELYDKYLVKNCRIGTEFYNTDAYLLWEEEAFMQALRTSLVPATANGDHSALYGTPWWPTFDKLVAPRDEDSLCEKFNDTELKKKQERQVERDQFEDMVLNTVFNVR